MLNKSKIISSISICCTLAALLVAGCATRGDRPIRESDYPSGLRVACIGDSITYGYGIQDRERQSYPSQLGFLLGNKFEVRNFGVNGATALRHGTRPYSGEASFRDALAFRPDVVFIELGTNDTSAKNWPAYKQEFLADYLELIKSFQKLKTKPRIYLCRPPPLFRDRGKPYDTDKILADEVIPRIDHLAVRNHLTVIDMYAAFASKSSMFSDGVHPDATGAHLMAEVIRAKLMGVN